MRLYRRVTIPYHANMDRPIWMVRFLHASDKLGMSNDKRKEKITWLTNKRFGGCQVSGVRIDY